MTGSDELSPDVIQRERVPLRSVALLFLKLGFIAFGGPAAHIAMMNSDVVERRRWLSRERFLDLLAAASLIPGPSSTELAIYIGYTRAGWMGLVLGGVCFIIPAALIVTGFAWAYVRFGSSPQIAGVLYGVKPVVIIVIIQAIWQLGRTAIKSRALVLIGTAALAASALGANQLLVLLTAGVVSAAIYTIATQNRRAIRQARTGVFANPFLLTAPAGGAAALSVGLWPLFLFFLKIGAVVFGSGYVLLAFLKGDLVEHWHWLTNSQLLDAVAIGQVTPGPVFTTATFIGYLLAGPRGAVVATAGIFLPSFVFVAVSGPLVPRIRRSPISGAFLDGVSVGAIALMAVVTYQLFRVALVDVPTILIALAGAAALFYYRINSAWLVLSAAAIGSIARMLIK